MQSTNQLTSLQLELLKVFALEPTEDELLQVKKMLGTFFAQRLVKSVDRSVFEKEITEEDLDSWLNNENQ